MSNALDDLRQELSGVADTHPGLGIMEAIDRFEVEHPGLVDYTYLCAVCRKPVNPATSPSFKNIMANADDTAICVSCYDTLLGALMKKLGELEAISRRGKA